MTNELLLLSGQDIPFFSARVNIYQPKLKDIALIGEDAFFSGCYLLNFSKDLLSEEDRTRLSDVDDFDVLMAIVLDEQAILQKLHLMQLLALLFPLYEVTLSQDGIYLTNSEEAILIDKELYPEFKQIVVDMFDLGAKSKEEFNPKNKAAAIIAEKLKKGREKLAALKNPKQTDKIAVFTRYASILSIGLQLDLNDLMNYTVYQLYDSFKRYQLHYAFDINMRAKMAGATDLDEVDNWMDDIHS